jgi:hypothetical protein
MHFFLYLGHPFQFLVLISYIKLLDQASPSFLPFIWQNHFGGTFLGSLYTRVDGPSMTQFNILKGQTMEIKK